MVGWLVFEVFLLLLASWCWSWGKRWWDDGVEREDWDAGVVVHGGGGDGRMGWRVGRDMEG